MKQFCVFIFLLLPFFAQAQNPLVKMWDKRFGGTFIDVLHCFMQTRDGGYILAGKSASEIGGDKTEQPRGNKFWNGADSVHYEDYWIVKIDSLGNKQWDKVIGGTGSEDLYCMDTTKDGGFILGGRSFSGVGGDKTEPNFDTVNTIASDFWIVKTDSLGNKQWDKTFGGEDEDQPFSIKQTSDGGYLVGGYTGSGISGNKTTINFGSADYWVIKLDSLGNKQWEKDFGGTGYDIIHALAQTSDGNYLLGGLSASGISGNKTTPLWGSWLSDFWLLKIDSLGNVLWEKDIGGDSAEFFYSLSQTVDGGFILGGGSCSKISGNKTQDTVGRNDLWIVKTDPFGNVQWDKVFGGFNDEYMFGSTTQTADHGYFISTPSWSNIGGNKTEPNLGQMQTWVVKTDSIGNFLWDRTIFTTSREFYSGRAIQSGDGCYVIANATNSGIGGYKTQPNWDPFDNSFDYWIVKFCDSTLINNSDEIGVKGFYLFPNPAAEKLIINASEKIFSLKIFDITGRCHATEVISEDKAEIDIHFFSDGMYFLQIETEKGIFTKRFIKE